MIALRENTFAFRIKEMLGLVLSMLPFHRYEGWTMTVELERRIRALKINATGGCLAYYIKTIKQTNLHSTRSISLPDIF